MDKGYFAKTTAVCFYTLALLCILPDVNASNAFSLHPGKTEFIKLPLKEALNATRVTSSLKGVTARIYKKYSDAIQLKISVVPRSKPGKGELKIEVDKKPVSIPIYVFGLGNAKISNKGPAKTGELQEVEINIPRVVKLSAKTPGQPHCKGASDPRTGSLVTGKYPLKYRAGAYRFWITSTSQQSKSKCSVQMIEKSLVDRTSTQREITIEFERG